jgi:5-methylcytosine-specific restriction endonuclease McrA
MPDGVVHWWLQTAEGEVIDPTHDQYHEPVPYAQGRSGGFLTASPSKRAREVMKRVTGAVKTAQELVLIEPREYKFHGGGYPFFYIPSEQKLYVMPAHAFHTDMALNDPELRELIKNYMVNTYRTTTAPYIPGRIHLDRPGATDGEVDVYGEIVGIDAKNHWQPILQSMVDQWWGTEIPVTTSDYQGDEFEAEPDELGEYRDVLSGYEQQMGRVAKIVNLPAFEKTHDGDEPTKDTWRRTFVYLPTTDTLYLANHNAYHTDIWRWIAEQNPDMDWEPLHNREVEPSLGLIQRNYDDKQLEVHYYHAEGAPLPDHMMFELEEHLGEHMSQVPWQYPRPLADDWYGDWDDDDYGATEQWPTDTKSIARLSTQFDHPIENPVNYDFVPLSPLETTAWDTLTPRERHWWRRKALKLNNYSDNRGKVRPQDLHALYTRYQGFCAYCGGPGATSWDHVIPLSQGGQNAIENLLPCHRECNGQLNDWDQRMNPFDPNSQTKPPGYWGFQPAEAAVDWSRSDRVPYQFGFAFMYHEGELYVTHNGHHPDLMREYLRQQGSQELEAIQGVRAFKEQVKAGKTVFGWVNRDDIEFVSGSAGDDMAWHADPKLKAEAHGAVKQYMQEHKTAGTLSTKFINITDDIWPNYPHKDSSSFAWMYLDGTLYVLNTGHHPDIMRWYLKNKALGSRDLARAFKEAIGEGRAVFGWTVNADSAVLSGNAPDSMARQAPPELQAEALAACDAYIESLRATYKRAGTQPVELMVSDDRRWHFDDYLKRYDRFAWVYFDGTLYCGDLHRDIMAEMRREGLDFRNGAYYGWYDPWGKEAPKQPNGIDYVTDYGEQHEALLPEVEAFFERYPPKAVLDYLKHGTRLGAAPMKVMRVKTPRTKFRGVYGMPFSYVPSLNTIFLADSHTYHTRMWPRLPEEFRRIVLSERASMVNGHIVPVKGDYLGGVQFYLEQDQIVDEATAAAIQDALVPYVEQLEFEEEEYVEETKPGDQDQLSLLGKTSADWGWLMNDIEYKAQEIAARHNWEMTFEWRGMPMSDWDGRKYYNGDIGGRVDFQVPWFLAESDETWLPDQITTVIFTAPPIVDKLTYYIALHELGHMAFVSQYGRDVNSQEEEFWAMHWAIENGGGVVDRATMEYAADFVNSYFTGEAVEQGIKRRAPSLPYKYVEDTRFQQLPLSKVAGTTMYRVLPKKFRDFVMKHGLVRLPDHSGSMDDARLYVFQDLDSARLFAEHYRHYQTSDIWRINAPTDLPIKFDPRDYPLLGVEHPDVDEVGYWKPTPFYLHVDIPPEYVELVDTVVGARQFDTSLSKTANEDDIWVDGLPFHEALDGQVAFLLYPDLLVAAESTGHNDIRRWVRENRPELLREEILQGYSRVVQGRPSVSSYEYGLHTEDSFPGLTKRVFNLALFNEVEVADFDVIRGLSKEAALSPSDFEKGDYYTEVIHNIWIYNGVTKKLYYGHIKPTVERNLSSWEDNHPELMRRYRDELGGENRDKNVYGWWVRRIDDGSLRPIIHSDAFSNTRRWEPLVEEAFEAAKAAISEQERPIVEDYRYSSRWSEMPPIGSQWEWHNDQFENMLTVVRLDPRNEVVIIRGQAGHEVEIHLDDWHEYVSDGMLKTAAATDYIWVYDPNTGELLIHEEDYGLVRHVTLMAQLGDKEYAKTLWGGHWRDGEIDVQHWPAKILDWNMSIEEREQATQEALKEKEDAYAAVRAKLGSVRVGAAIPYEWVELYDSASEQYMKGSLPFVYIDGKIYIANGSAYHTAIWRALKRNDLVRHISTDQYVQGWVSISGDIHFYEGDEAWPDPDPEVLKQIKQAVREAHDERVNERADMGDWLTTAAWPSNPAWVYDPEVDKLYVGQWHQDIIRRNKLMGKAKLERDPDGDFDLVRFTTSLVLGWHHAGVFSDYGASTATEEQKQRALELAEEYYADVDDDPRYTRTAAVPNPVPKYRWVVMTDGTVFVDEDDIYLNHPQLFRMKAKPLGYTKDDIADAGYRSQSYMRMLPWYQENADTYAVEDDERVKRHTGNLVVRDDPRTDIFIFTYSPQSDTMIIGNRRWNHTRYWQSDDQGLIAGGVNLTSGLWFYDESMVTAEIEARVEELIDEWRSSNIGVGDNTTTPTVSSHQSTGTTAENSGQSRPILSTTVLQDSALVPSTAQLAQLDGQVKGNHDKLWGVMTAPHPSAWMPATYPAITATHTAMDTTHDLLTSEWSPTPRPVHLDPHQGGTIGYPQGYTGKVLFPTDTTSAFSGTRLADWDEDSPNIDVAYTEAHGWRVYLLDTSLIPGPPPWENLRRPAHWSKEQKLIFIGSEGTHHNPLLRGLILTGLVQSPEDINDLKWEIILPTGEIRMSLRFEEGAQEAVNEALGTDYDPLKKNIPVGLEEGLRVDTSRTGAEESMSENEMSYGGWTLRRLPDTTVYGMGTRWSWVANPDTREIVYGSGWTHRPLFKELGLRGDHAVNLKERSKPAAGIVWDDGTSWLYGNAFIGNTVETIMKDVYLKSSANEPPRLPRHTGAIQLREGWVWGEWHHPEDVYTPQPFIYQNHTLWLGGDDAPTHPFVVRKYGLDREKPMLPGWVYHESKQIAFQSWEENVDRSLIEEAMPLILASLPEGYQRVPQRTTAASEWTIHLVDNAPYEDVGSDWLWAPTRFPVLFQKERKIMFVGTQPGSHHVPLMRAMKESVPFQAYTTPTIRPTLSWDFLDNGKPGRGDHAIGSTPGGRQAVQKAWAMLHPKKPEPADQLSLFEAKTSDFYPRERAFAFIDGRLIFGTSHSSILRRAREEGLLLSDDPQIDLGWMQQLDDDHWEPESISYDNNAFVRSSSEYRAQMLAEARRLWPEHMRNLKVSKDSLVLVDQHLWDDVAPHVKTFKLHDSETQTDVGKITYGIIEDEKRIHVGTMHVDGLYRKTDAFMRLIEPLVPYLSQGYTLDATYVNPRLKNVVERWFGRHATLGDIGSDFFCWVYCGQCKQLWIDGYSYHGDLYRNNPEIRRVHAKEGHSLIWGQVALYDNPPIRMYSDWYEGWADQQEKPGTDDGYDYERDDELFANAQQFGYFKEAEPLVEAWLDKEREGWRKDAAVTDWEVVDVTTIMEGNDNRIFKPDRIAFVADTESKLIAIGRGLYHKPLIRMLVDNMIGNTEVEHGAELNRNEGLRDRFVAGYYFQADKHFDPESGYHLEGREVQTAVALYVDQHPVLSKTAAIKIVEVDTTGVQYDDWIGEDIAKVRRPMLYQPWDDTVYIGPTKGLHGQIARKLGWDKTWWDDSLRGMIVRDEILWFGSVPQEAQDAVQAWHDDRSHLRTAGTQDADLAFDPFSNRPNAKGLRGEDYGLDPRGTFVYVDGVLFWGDRIHPRMLKQIMEEHFDIPDPKIADFKNFIATHETAFGRVRWEGEFLWYMGGTPEFAEETAVSFVSWDFGDTAPETKEKVLAEIRKYAPDLEMEEE